MSSRLVYTCESCKQEIISRLDRGAHIRAKLHPWCPTSESDFCNYKCLADWLEKQKDTHRREMWGEPALEDATVEKIT